jgi:hypothetical protein
LGTMQKLYESVHIHKQQQQQRQRQRLRQRSACRELQDESCT